MCLNKVQCSKRMYLILTPMYEFDQVSIFSFGSDTNMLSEEIERLQSQNDNLKEKLEKNSMSNITTSTVSDFENIKFGD